MVSKDMTMAAAEVPLIIFSLPFPISSGHKSRQ